MDKVRSGDMDWIISVICFDHILTTGSYCSLIAFLITSAVLKLFLISHFMYPSHLQLWNHYISHSPSPSCLLLFVKYLGYCVMVCGAVSDFFFTFADITMLWLPLWLPPSPRIFFRSFLDLAKALATRDNRLEHQLPNSPQCPGPLQHPRPPCQNLPGTNSTPPLANVTIITHCWRHILRKLRMNLVACTETQIREWCSSSMARELSSVLWLQWTSGMCCWNSLISLSNVIVTSGLMHKMMVVSWAKIILERLLPQRKCNTLWHWWHLNFEAKNLPLLFWHKIN